ncbi:hypothetical protein V6N12_008833 [Hibiscus sabdariffa]|uniref:non-specific serine/threonine protein kinase n=1 Tax=Hibiscus sabdariffa TaxID=183260 RepID=A0ABR2C3X4_9ROSI
MVTKKMFVFWVIAMGCFSLLRFADSKVPKEEVDALQEIATAMGSIYWKFNGDSCEIKRVGITLVPPKNSKHEISCECMADGTVCHVVRIVFKGYNLPGILPPQLVKLPYLREIDFAYNYLEGTIPSEWASMNLTFISLLVNRLSGEIPKYLGKFTTLTYLSLEANQFSGPVPPELGDLVNLKTLMLSSNQLTGNLPPTFSLLRNLTDFRINDNNFNGRIPGFIQNWEQLNRLEMHASGLKGPIPVNLSLLRILTVLRISDINGTSQDFPALGNMESLVTLVLRNCNISGKIPDYIWGMESLEMLDLSFNNLGGEIPARISADRLRFVFLSGNLLTGDVPDSILKQGASIDLSYNDFKPQGPGNPESELELVSEFIKEQHVRVFFPFFVVFPSGVWTGSLPCKKSFTCPRYSNCLHVNCGGKDIRIKENKANVLYEGDGDVEGGVAKFYINENSYWGFSSTGDFMDDNDFQNTRYTVLGPSSNVSELYSTARRAPISLTYFHYCLVNGNYTITFNFAEIQFTPDETYNSLGRRIFDVYIQEKLVWKDFSIEAEAMGALKPLVKQVSNVSVMNNHLEIRFCWTGKGTTRIPQRSVYGPLVNAISVVSGTKPCLNRRRSRSPYIIGFGVLGSCLGFLVVGLFWWKGHLLGQYWQKRGTKEDMPSGTFTLKQIKVATNDFDPAYKIGEGGFGPVYKGQLPDGTNIAVKQLSSKSRQGNREFLNEIGMISCLQHPNLVKLHGFCVEGDQLLLVYEYMENNSLARALFGSECNKLELDWPTRLKICIGIAKGSMKRRRPTSPPELLEPCQFLSFSACHLRKSGNLTALLDERLRSEVKNEEVELMVKVALLCTNASASLRPTMSEVVNMLEGRTNVPDLIPEPSSYTEDLRFKAMRDLCQQKEDQSENGYAQMYFALKDKTCFEQYMLFMRLLQNLERRIRISATNLVKINKGQVVYPSPPPNEPPSAINNSTGSPANASSP